MNDRVFWFVPPTARLEFAVAALGLAIAGLGAFGLVDHFQELIDLSADRDGTGACLFGVIFDCDELVQVEVTGAPDIHAGKGVPGRAQLYFDDQLVGNADFPYTTPLVFGVAGGALECGMDSGSPVTPEYAPPFEFTGTIDSVTVDVSGELIKDEEAEIRQIMARQ